MSAAPAPAVAAPATGTRAFPSASLYVGDLHPDVTETVLYDAFSGVGAVLSVRVCRDSSTRRSLGYGYVNYGAYDDAERALQLMNHKDLKGKNCRVMWSQRDPTVRKSGQGNIFIKNLPASVDNKKLNDDFSVFGNILSAKVATNSKGQSHGYGFVHFESDEAAQKAIDHFNGRTMDGKVLSVEMFKPQRDRGTANRSLFTNVFVKNLPAEWNQEELEKYFNQFGQITSVMLAFEEEKKSSKMFGFINYSTMEEANAAIEKAHNAEVGSPPKKLYVARAQKKDERVRTIRADLKQKYLGTNLYVKNLPDDVDDEKLRAFFSKFGAVSSVRVMVENGRSKGFGFASFATPDDATKALTEANNSAFFGKPLFVSVHQPRDERRAMLESQASQRTKIPQGPHMGFPGMANMFRNPMNSYGRGMPGMAPWMQMPGGMGHMPHHLIPMNGRPNVRGPAGPRIPRQPGARGPAGPYVNNQGPRPGRVPAPRPPRTSAVPGPAAPLDANQLAQMADADAKQVVGERLYPMVMSFRPDEAAKITGMLLEMELSEVLALVESREELAAKVEEAFTVLKAAMA